jgi:hypothetical protein
MNLHTTRLTELAAEIYGGFALNYGVPNQSKIPFKQLKRMREHPAIKLGLDTVKALIIGSDYSVESDDEEEKEFITKQWLEAPLRDKFMRQWLLSLDYGFSAQEKIETTDEFNGKTFVVYNDFACPDPEYVWWLGSDSKNKGDYNGFLQRQFKETRIAAENSVWAACDMEHGNYYGRPLFKAAYMTWYAVELNELFANRTMELYGEPYVMVFYPRAIGAAGTSDDNQTAAVELGKKIRNEAVITIPSEYEPETRNRLWDIKIESPKGTPAPWVEYLSFQYKRILWAAGIPTRVLDEGSAGSYAEAAQKADILFMNVEARIKEFLAAENEHVVKPLLEKNFPNPEDCKITAAPLVDAKRAMIIDILKTALPNMARSDSELKEALKRAAEDIGILERVPEEETEIEPPPEPPPVPLPAGEGDAEENLNDTGQ